MPRANEAMSIGFDNNTNLIWLLGGNWPNYGALFSFNVSRWNESNSITDYGYPVSVDHRTVSQGQAYVQKDNILYCIQYDTGNLLQFDVSTQSITTYPNQPSSSLSHVGCLANIDDYIIYTIYSSTYILNLSNQIWTTSGNPIMVDSNRKWQSCIVQPITGYLYVIGGQSGPNYLESIEKLYVGDMANISQYMFNTLSGTLTTQDTLTTGGGRYMRAILYKTDIYVIGGYYWSGSAKFIKDIDVIDTTTDTISVYNQQLYEEISYTAPILIGTRVYVFGGYNGTNTVNYWQYFDVLSIYKFYVPFRSLHATPNPYNINQPEPVLILNQQHSHQYSHQSSHQYNHQHTHQHSHQYIHLMIQHPVHHLIQLMRRRLGL